ncbi:zf-HC2 domain-containing protein [Leptolyngbya sp. 7M]|uniref:zf-HC2 domain-containing protein n=1 Tax=Leptolyngbya sp. 7M TaxID=2812896 RepID=UPI001B8D1666|nr:zf-HC2 domain-containing protein [Leptolyngbya sp. 7M]QYO67040.1 zf-HC2 domain-containing protein [Leptolyngbya sp. 7M]
MKHSTAKKGQSCLGVELQSYLDGELTKSEENLIEEHLSSCKSCRLLLNTEKQLILALENAFQKDQDTFLPKDFARTVSAVAVNDIHGLRSERERSLGILIAILLSFLATIAVVASGSGGFFVVDRGLALSAAVFHTLYLIASGMVAIIRPLSSHLLTTGSVWFAAAVFFSMIMLLFARLFCGRRKGSA